MVEDVHNTQEITLEYNYSQNLSPFWPHDVILTLKTARFEHMSKFLQIFAYFTTITLKLSYKTKVEIVHITLNGLH